MARNDVQPAMPNRMSAKKHRAKPTHKFRRTTIEPAENGGYVVEHDQHQDDGPGYNPSIKHAFGSAKEMHAHIQRVYPAKRANVQEAGEQA